MNWFINLSTRIKLFISFGLLIFFTMIVMLTAYNGMSALRKSLDDLFAEDFVTSVELIDLKANMNRVRAQLLEMIVLNDRTKQQTLEKDILERSKEIDQGLNRVADSLKNHREEVQEFQEMVADLAEYRKTRDEQFAFIAQDNIAEAERLGTTLQEGRYNNIRRIIKVLGEKALARANVRLDQANTRAASLFQTFAIIGAIVVILGVCAALFLSGILAKPLREITTAAERIASGDLAVAIASGDRRDEVGDMTRAFETMSRYLRDIAGVSKQIAGGDLAVAIQPVSDKDILGNAFADMTGYLRCMAAVARQVADGDLTVSVRPVSDKDILGNAFAEMTAYLREMASISRQVAGGDLAVAVKPISDRDVLGNAFADMTANLRKLTQEIGDGINILASSASEILASTTQIASGMAETATSVSETTATVEEVKQTAQLSAKKSRSVSENAQTATLIAEQGNGAVTETMEGIGHIRELMVIVAESVVMLSEQTQAIGEIITVVNDLAQQSNLLAVNAAIEASKAGEQGKGFTVVAQEIKSLADQSKQATEQVRAILGDIQKATGKSVLAAEQVSKAVESGVRQAAESGESIGKLATNIGEAARAAAQIAASSQQQLAGMEQVAMAMESIKQATQQNVSGTKQAEQAAHTLNGLGQKLQEMVARFKV